MTTAVRIRPNDLSMVIDTINLPRFPATTQQSAPSRRIGTFGMALMASRYYIAFADIDASGIFLISELGQLSGGLSEIVGIDAPPNRRSTSL